MGKLDHEFRKGPSPERSTCSLTRSRTSDREGLSVDTKQTNKQRMNRSRSIGRRHYAKYIPHLILAFPWVPLEGSSSPVRGWLRSFVPVKVRSTPALSAYRGCSSSALGARMGCVRRRVHIGGSPDSIRRRRNRTATGEEVSEGREVNRESIVDRS